MPAIVGFPQLVEEAVAHFGPLFVNRPERDHLGQYLTGLLIAQNKTVSGIAREFADSPDQSCLNRFITQVPWDPKQLNERRLQWLQEDPLARYSDQGTISIDNVLVAHTGELITDVGCFWDHCEKRYLIAHDYIIAGYAAQGGKSFPLEYRRFIKHEQCHERKIDFKSHTVLVGELVTWCVQQNIAGTFAFDSWFSCPETLNLIHQMKRGYVGELKSNRHVFYRGQELTALELSQVIPTSARRALSAKDHSQWYFTCTVKIPKVNHPVRVLWLWADKKDSIPLKILATNRTSWEVRRIQRAYQARWRGSECFHRDSKQHLGMGDCQIRNGQGQTRHMYLVFLSHSLLLRQLGRRPCAWALHKLTTIGEGCRALIRETLSRTINWAIEKREVYHWKIERIRQTLALP